MTPTSGAPRFDEVIHAPNRLQICAMLSSVESLAFAAIRDALSVSDPVLSKHVKVLQSAGYVRMTKAASGNRVRTWLSLTPSGRKALAGHLEELRRIAALATSGIRPTSEDTSQMRHPS